MLNERILGAEQRDANNSNLSKVWRTMDVETNLVSSKKILE